ncbi:YdgA family protein [Xenorhabdus szentirmaii]|uniref:YdgA family protein n=1 Tax=Xenorhabdus szentirmaii TaxID=290112 RepID=UPI0032B76310
MKKSLVAVSVIVALGAAWTGASWYTGKKIENHLDSQLAKVNAIIAAQYPKDGNDLIELQKKDFKRGIFSSNVTFVLNSKGSQDEQKGIIFKSDISHGPFPVANVVKFKLAPKLAVIHTELEKNETLKQLFEITKDKSLFTVDTTIGYSKALSFGIDLAPVEHKENNTTFGFPGAKIHIDANNKLDEFSLSIKGGGMAINLPESKSINSLSLKDIDLSATVHMGKDNRLSKFLSTMKGGEIAFNLPREQTISIKNIGSSSDIKRNQFGSYLGNTAYSIGEINLKGFSSDVKDMSIEGIKSSTIISEDKNKNINNQSSYGIDTVKVNDVDLGSINVGAALNHLDGQAHGQLEQKLYDFLLQSFKNDKNDIDLLDESIKLNADILALLPSLLKHNPQLNMPVSYKNSKGEGTVNFNFTLNDLPKDPNDFNGILGNTEKVIRALSKDMSLDVKLSESMLVELFSLTSTISGKTDKKAAEENSKKLVNMLLSGFLSENILTKDGDTIALNFHYDNDKVKFNGKEYSLHQFLLDYGFTGSYDDEQDQYNETELPVAE